MRPRLCRTGAPSGTGVLRLVLTAIIASGIAVSARTDDASAARPTSSLGSAAPGPFGVPIPATAVVDPRFPAGADTFSYLVPAGAAKLRQWYQRRLPWREDWNGWQWCGRGSLSVGESAQGTEVRTYTRGEGTAPEALRVGLRPLSTRDRVALETTTSNAGGAPERYRAGLMIWLVGDQSCREYFKLPA